MGTKAKSEETSAGKIPKGLQQKKYQKKEGELGNTRVILEKTKGILKLSSDCPGMVQGSSRTG